MKKLVIPKVDQASATELPYPDNYFDAVFTDLRIMIMFPIPIFLTFSMYGLKEALVTFIQNFL